MNKTVTVTLNGIIFYIEEAAYEQLKEYLESVEEYFQRSGDGAEIVQDMETSIADKFSEKINGAKKVISKKDVEELIRTMGTINDFKTDNSGNNSKKEEQGTGNSFFKDKSGKNEKKLYRDPDDVIIAGVCSGIAAFFNVEPVLIRLVFFVTIFFGGAGILAYLVLWIIMPVAKTNTQKLEMQGAIVTLKKLEEIVKEKAEDIKKKASDGEVKNYLALPFKFIGAIFKGISGILRTIVPLCATIVGIVLIIACATAIAGIGAMLLLMIFNPDPSFINLDIPVKEIAGAAQYHLGLTAGAFIALIPLIFVLTIGVAMVRRKNVFNVVFNSILVGFWMIAIIMFTVIAVGLEPRIQEAVDEYEVAERTTREIDLQDFENVYISGMHEANIIQGNEFKVVASGRTKDIDRLDLSVKDKQLKIKSWKEKGVCIFCDYRGVEFEIVMPTLSKVALSGSSKISASNFTSDNFEAVLSGASQANLGVNSENFLGDISGASKIEVFGSSTKFDITASNASSLLFSAMQADQLKINLSGASKAEMSGSLHVLNADLSGVSKISAFDCSIDEARIEASGASKVEVLVNKSLVVSTEGVSKIYYKGEAVLDKKFNEIDTDNNIDEEDTVPSVERVKADVENEVDSPTVNDDDPGNNIIQIK